MPWRLYCHWTFCSLNEAVWRENSTKIMYSPPRSELNQVCTKSLLTLSVTIYHGASPCFIAGKTEQLTERQEPWNTIIEGSGDSTLSIPHVWSLTPHSELYGEGTLSPILYMGHRDYFPKFWEVLRGRTGVGTWIFLTLCPLPLVWTTAQVPQMLGAVTPGEVGSKSE